MKILTNILLVILLLGCASTTNITEEKLSFSTTPEIINTPLEIEMIKGRYHNHPSFAIWVEDLNGNYIETLYVTQYVAKGVFGHGEIEPGKWSNKPGEVRRPASLPYWAHKRNIQAEDGLYVPSPKTAVADALTGATPKGSFILETGTKEGARQKFKVLFEINQPWDSNEFWTNNKYPDDNDYLTSLQPALVYSTIIKPENNAKEYTLNLVGHSDPSGKTGELYPDLSTLTTAKEIVQKIVVLLK